MDGAQTTVAYPAFCELFDKPNECFDAYRSRLLKLKHPWDYLECTHCKFARINATIVHVPEPDGEMEPRRFFPKPKASEFEDGVEAKRTETRGKKPGLACSKGHPWAKFGLKRKSGGYQCRLCHNAKKRERYARRKAA